MLAQHLRSGLLAGFAVVVSTQIAGAVEAGQFAEKLFAYYEEAGYEATWSGAYSSGDSVTIRGTELKLPEANLTIPLGDLTFNGVVEDGKGGYDIAKVEPFDFSFSYIEDGDEPVDLRVSVEDATTTNVHVPAVPDMSSAENLLTYENSTTGPIEVVVNGMNVFTAESSHASSPAAGSDNIIDFTFGLNGMSVDLSDIPNQESLQTLDALGYTRISGNVTANGSWDLNDGTMTLSEYVTDLNDVGKLDLKFSLSGVTLEFIKGMQEMQQQMADMGDDAKAQQAMGLAMMGMMQQLTFNSLSISFDDGSVTGKVLDMVAGQQGMSADQLVQSIKGMLPIMLAQLNNPDFQQNVSTAVGAYLDNPQNIEISAMPATPLPLASIMGAGMGSPESLPTLLNVQVKANQ